MERRNITELEGKRIVKVEDRKGFIAFIGPRNKVLFTVPHNNLFDVNGNHFENDAEYVTEEI